MNKFKNVKTPHQLLKFMGDISYKWMDQNGMFHSEIIPEMHDSYSLMSPDEVLSNMCGICVDQCELERYWFSNNNYQFKVMCIQIIRGDSSPGHIFLIYKDNNKFYWFENAWYDERGIHEYNSYNELIFDIKSKFINQNSITPDELNNLIIKEQARYPYHISYAQMDDIDKLENNQNDRITSK